MALQEGNRRPQDFEGTDRGIDREHTKKLYDAMLKDGHVQLAGCLRSVLLGSTWIADRLFRAGLVTTPW